MFSVRRALRFGARLMCVQSSACYRHAAILCKPNGIIGHPCTRLVHEDANEQRKELGKLEGKMKLMFTCQKCSTRNSKLISKLAYHKGVIVVRCDGCKNNHLIADNLGWFTDLVSHSHENGRINIEKIMALKGESVRKILNDSEGYFEALVNEEFNLHRKNTNATRDSSSDECEIKKIESKES